MPFPYLSPNNLYFANVFIVVLLTPRKEKENEYKPISAASPDSDDVSSASSGHYGIPSSRDEKEFRPDELKIDKHLS